MSQHVSVCGPYGVIFFSSCAHLFFFLHIHLSALARCNYTSSTMLLLLLVCSIVYFVLSFSSFALFLVGQWFLFCFLFSFVSFFVYLCVLRFFVIIFDLAGLFRAEYHWCVCNSFSLSFHWILLPCFQPPSSLHSPLLLVRVFCVCVCMKPLCSYMQHSR